MTLDGMLDCKGLSIPLHSRTIRAPARRAITLGVIMKGLLRGWYVSLLPFPDIQSRLQDGPGIGKRRARGIIP